MWLLFLILPFVGLAQTGPNIDSLFKEIKYLRSQLLKDTVQFVPADFTVKGTITNKQVGAIDKTAPLLASQAATAAKVDANNAATTTTLAQLTARIVSLESNDKAQAATIATNKSALDASVARVVALEAGLKALTTKLANITVTTTSTYRSGKVTSTSKVNGNK